MRSLILITVLIFTMSQLTGCQTVKNKTDEIVKKENEKLGQFIGQPVSELKIVMGLPDKEEKNYAGSNVYVYKTKKYGISCVRKFELNNNNMIIGFVSKGCF